MYKPFYVYRILGEMGETVYIGKGTGRRLDDQKRRFMSEGEIIESFATEQAAYRRERVLIAKFSPPLNQCAGGAGGIFGRTSELNEEDLFRSVAKLIRKIATLREYTIIGVPVSKADLLGIVERVASRFEPEQFAARLKPYNVNVVTEYV